MGDPPLFVSRDRAPQLPYVWCRLPAESMTRSRRRLRATNTPLYHQASEACQKAVSNSHDIDLCIDDVMMTGDMELVDTIWA